MPSKFQCELISWGQVVSLTNRLAGLINRDSFHPDVIIAIGRGGYVPARLLADYLDIMNLTGIKVEHYIAGAHRQRSAMVKYPLNIDVSGQRVLVVDDVSDSGDTFTVTMKHILQHSTPDVIKTAVLHHKTVSAFMPNYYAAKVVKWRWLIYPWAVIEDVSSFVAELKPCPADPVDLNEQLYLAYGIRVPDKVLRYVIAKRFDMPNV